ncbi:putative N(4)-(beta-N-acetylglucosaminyl)-L-asparaginase GD10667 [Drosophila eugracilis]|uniref:putative N(4)-(beta-N-acetylglucosaminyl)-L-asparaginase GD10667 n=1 Tax=Drosophila eugracilis TaxID=29029 RepID=UPI001BD9D23E|nr:putative N(4)-(beta-N-acetylglucosaminyl)-L-asparaginase GD10667 [Drosophila eugracilis]
MKFAVESFWLFWLTSLVSAATTSNVTSSGQTRITGQLLPMVINTWPFSDANEEAWRLLNLSKGGIGQTRNAVVGGISECERLQCDKAVGYGGNPDERGDTSLDALLMDGSTMDVGAVAYLRRIRSAIKVARHVLENTRHSLLVGNGAEDFANAMGFSNESLNTPETRAIWQNWTVHNCQRNFWQNVYPDPKTSCGPYQPLTLLDKDAIQSDPTEIGPNNHDTVTMAAIDVEGNIHVGTSTNGLRHTIPGRVGDASIPGSGAYADNEVGAAISTGNGDILMRFLPSLLAVEAMRAGKTPAEAADLAVQRIRKRVKSFDAAIIAVDRFGTYGVACHGTYVFTKGFSYMVSNPAQPKRKETVDCTTGTTSDHQVIW